MPKWYLSNRKYAYPDRVFGWWHDGFMKRLQLPKNKLARLAINVALVWLWLPIAGIFIADLLFKVIPLTVPPIYIHIVYCSIVFVPIALVTRYVWWGRLRSKTFSKIFSNKRIWGRLKPRPRITRSKDD